MQNAGPPGGTPRISTGPRGNPGRQRQEVQEAGTSLQRRQVTRMVTHLPEEPVEKERQTCSPRSFQERMGLLPGQERMVEKVGLPGRCRKSQGMVEMQVVGICIRAGIAGEPLPPGTPRNGEIGIPAPECECVCSAEPE